MPLAFCIRRQVSTVDIKLMNSEPIREKSSLNVRLIQALIIFILLEDEFQYPSFIVTKVSGLRILIKIRFEYDDPEDEPFLSYFSLMTSWFCSLRFK